MRRDKVSQRRDGKWRSPLGRDPVEEHKRVIVMPGDLRLIADWIVIEGGKYGAGLGRGPRLGESEVVVPKPAPPRTKKRRKKRVREQA